MKIIDITPEISEDLAVWPGAPAYERDVLLDTHNGDHISFSKISANTHIGAHTDAPNHYAVSDEGMSARSLHYYYGPCQVITAKTKKGEAVKIEDLSTRSIEAPRVLFKTHSFPNPNQWNEDFCFLSVELVEFLVKNHVILVGIDTPSIDHATSKTMDAHQVVHRNNLAILEGIVLEDVKDGLYTLIALPLKIRDADASPVRAVLIEN